MRFPSQAQKKHGNSVFKQKILALFSRGSHHKPKKRKIPFSNRRYWHYFLEKPKKTRKSRFQMRFPSQAQKKHGNSVFKQKILALFSRGCHHKPKKREIPFSNRRYWHYFPEAQKDTEIPFSNEVPITSPEKTRKFRFQIEDIDIIFQRLHHKPKRHKPKKRKIPFSNRRQWHYFPEKPKKTRKSRFQMRFPSQAQKKHGNSVFKQKILALFSRGFHHKPKKREIPFSNRRYWHYFPEKPKKTRKSRFQMRFPPQAQKKTRKFRFQIEDIGIIFQRLPSQAKKNNGNPVFKENILALFSRGSHHKPKKREIPFSNRRYWHYFPKFSKQDWPTNHFQIEDIVKQPMGKRKRPFQIEDIHYMHMYLPIFTPNSQNKIGRQTIFKQKILSNNQWGSGKDHFKQKIFIIPTPNFQNKIVRQTIF